MSEPFDSSDDENFSNNPAPTNEVIEDDENIDADLLEAIRRSLEDIQPSSNSHTLTTSSERFGRDSESSGRDSEDYSTIRATHRCDTFKQAMNYNCTLCALFYLDQNPALKDKAITSSGGILPIHMAIKNTNIELIDYLISIGSPLKGTLFMLFNLDNKTKLSTIVVILKILVDGGADKDERGDNGDTFLIAAIRRLILPLARKAIKLKFDPNAKNHTGLTALHVAVTTRNNNAISIILNSNINVRIKDDHGRTAFWLAQYYRNEFASQEIAIAASGKKYILEII